jgi:hypothetical protein
MPSLSQGHLRIVLFAGLVFRNSLSKEAFQGHIPAEYMSKYAAGKGKTARIASRNSRISRYG